MLADPIVAIETAIQDRLKAGLGKMVTSVNSYGGEFDEDLGQVARAFPACWVTFAGVLSTRPTSTSRQFYRAAGRFVVLVGQRSVQSEQHGRRGGVNGIGSYTLVRAVRRLLTNQDLELNEVSELQPGAVRTLFNGRLRSEALSVFACEFDTSWMEPALEIGRWPEPMIDPDTHLPVPGDPDAIFAEHGGRLDAPYPDLESIHLNHRLPTTPGDQPPDATDIVILKKDQS